MLESLMLSSLGAVLKETVGPLAKAAAEDWCKDRLKQGANAVIAQSAPSAMKKAVKQSLKNFIQLFGDELENCGLTRALVKHELAKPVGRLLADEAVITELCRAFETGVKGIDWQLLPAVWSTLSVPDNFPEEFEWEALARNYVRRVKGLVRKDEDLARQLELDQQRAIKESNEALVGVPVQFDLREYQESLKEKFGSLSLDSLDTTGAAYDSLRLWKIFVAQDVRECAEFAPQLYELPKERLLELQAAGEIDPLLSLDALEQRRRRYAERPIESVRGVVGLDGAGSVLRCVILGDPGSGKSTLLRALALGWAEKPVAALRDEPIPLLIELRLYAQDKDRGVCNDFLEYLHGGNTACRLNQLELDALLKSGKAVALFDGVDEVFDPVLREAVVTDIHRFSNRYPVVQMVVTSRWLGYKAEALRKAEFAHYMLQDLSDEQIEDFLERWHGLTFTAAQKEERERKQARLQRAIGESKAIRELGGNPLLLTMMAILNRNQELPRDRARLYEEASKVLLYQWDVEGKLYEQADLKHWQIDVRDKQAM
ncbi:MAG: NACHT domain-containing protein, partial [Cyanobacteria bacterium J06649_5]